MEVTSRRAFIIILVGGILVPGIADYYLSQAGAPSLGSFVWAVGFGTAVTVIWFGWLRPLDITGPPSDPSVWEVSADEEQEAHRTEGVDADGERTDTRSRTDNAPEPVDDQHE